MGRFDESVVIVTGSANGIGAATVERFVAEGALVGCLDIDEPANDRLPVRLGCGRDRVLPVTCDVREGGSQEESFDEVLQRFGRLDALVACAGIFEGGPLDEVPEARWNDVIATNLTGVLTSNRLAAQRMAADGPGSIVNVSSMAAKTSWPDSAEYSSSKTGVLGLTRSVAMELGPRQITVNAVCPGNTKTDMVAEVAKGVGAKLGMTADEWLAMRATDTALNRLAEPWEIAGVIAFLCSDDARYITGQAIEVDGGLVLS